MPIYAYKCGSCGHAKDVLQKISDPVLTTCPACGAEQFSKQVTAAGFQLKGSGWYATDFRNGSTPAAPAADGKPVDAKSGESKPAETQAASTKPAKPAESAPAPAAKSDGPSASGSRDRACACH
jgi:putative FmdB family regulatory protein